MIVLGIETATSEAGVALGGEDGVLASFRLGRSRRHIESMAPAITFVCESSGVDLDDVELVAVDVGPGGYTGIRVGLATARAIAYGIDVPLVGVPSLDLLAFRVRASDRRIVSVIDARRGEVYWASYRGGASGLTRLDEPAVASPEALAGRLADLGEPLLVVGTGATVYRDALASVPELRHAGSELDCPSAASLVELVRLDPAVAATAGPSAPDLLYLRAPDASTPEERAARRPPRDGD